MHICVQERQSKGFGGGIGGYSNYTNRLLELEQKFQSKNMNFIFFGVTHPWKWKLKLLEFIIRAIVDVVMFSLQIIKTRPDIVHVHGLYWKSTYREFFFVYISKLIGAKVIYEARAGNFFRCVEESIIQKTVLKLISKKVDLITVQGQKDLKNLENFAQPTEARVFPNFISRRFENNIPKKIEARDPKSVSFVGSVGFSKRCDLIYELAKFQPDFEFHLYGTVEDGFAKIDKPSNVMLHGRTSQSKLMKKLTWSTYFIFLSDMSGEGQPNALIEAVFMGLIPIAVDKGYIREIVPDTIPLYALELNNMKNLSVFFKEMTEKNYLDATDLNKYREDKSSAAQADLLMHFYKAV